MAPAIRARIPGREPKKMMPRMPMTIRPILWRSGACRQRRVRMATMRLGMLPMSTIIGMNSMSQLKMVVSIASVAGSREGVMIARNVGKKNHAKAA